MVADINPKDKPALPLDQLVPRLQQFVSEYPSTVYIEKVSYDLVFQTREYQRFLEQFPNSGFSWAVVSHLMTTAEDKKSLVQRITADHPDTRCAWAARQLLRWRE